MELLRQGAAQQLPRGEPKYVACVSQQGLASHCLFDSVPDLGLTWIGIIISNERPSPYARQAQHTFPPKRVVVEATLKSEMLQIERNTFIFTLKENDRGRFLRITEDVNGRRDNIIVPSTGLDDFSKIVSEMVCADKQLSKSSQP